GPPWRLAITRPKRTLEAFLYAGVTTVLDLGNLTPDVFRLREEIRRGDVLGPRLFAAGPMFTASGGHPVALLRLALPVVAPLVRRPALLARGRHPAGSTARVAELLVENPDVVKVAIDRIPLDAPRIAREVIAAITSAAHEHGIRCVAHVG